uniref:Uncharacterized protein n=1 Tax=Lactuca sativa TaxID=4236 RepID=A0A9R1XA93_LACSA|nr:hypothetical protein LSAT_V11C500246560 [Lactuca sativa]
MASADFAKSQQERKKSNKEVKHNATMGENYSMLLLLIFGKVNELRQKMSNMEQAMEEKQSEMNLQMQQMRNEMELQVQRQLEAFMKQINPSDNPPTVCGH